MRIPGAQFFDIDAVADHASGLPHMLPVPRDFAAAVAALGVSSSSHVVVYDQRGIFSAPRLWWMFRVFGHDNVQVLNGGLPAWLAAGGTLEHGEPDAPAPGQFTATYRAEMVRALDDLKRNLLTREELVLDARAAARFAGTVPEPRPGMRSGHIPDAISLPFTTLLQRRQISAAIETAGKIHRTRHYRRPPACRLLRLGRHRLCAGTGTEAGGLARGGDL